MCADDITDLWPARDSLAHIDDRWSLSGLTVVILENAWMKVVIAPQQGAHIVSLEYRPLSRQWLWQNPRISLSSAPFGAPFDDYWSGGIDAFFPTCYPSTYLGTSIPEGGEGWSIPWQWRETTDTHGAQITLTAGARIWPVQMQRTVRLRHDRPLLELGFHFLNVGVEPLPFLFGLHPAMTIREGDRLDLPDGVVQVDEVQGETMGAPGQRYRWPYLQTVQGQRDMRRMRGITDGTFGGHFHRPTEGVPWWALTDPVNRVGIGLVAPSAQFQGLWLWQVFGGWKGYHHLVAEPWTGYPIKLDDALEQGSGAWFAPQQEVQLNVEIVCYQGISAVKEIQCGGLVTAAHAPGTS